MYQIKNGKLHHILNKIKAMLSLNKSTSL